MLGPADKRRPTRLPPSRDGAHHAAKAASTSAGSSICGTPSPLSQSYSAVTTLLDDTGRRTGRIRDTGQTHLIESADEALAVLIISDRRLRVLCTRIGERHLAVSPDRLPAFRKAVLALGYPLA